METVGHGSRGSAFYTFCLFVCALFALLLLPPLGLAQSSLGSGRLEGTVLDPSGAVVAGAAVTARNTETGVSTTQRSDSEGHFLFVYLTPGTTTSRWRSPASRPLS